MVYFLPGPRTETGGTNEARQLPKPLVMSAANCTCRQLETLLTQLKLLNARTRCNCVHSIIMKRPDSL